MNREEFVRELRLALQGVVHTNLIEDNVRYYNDYIDMEIRKGKSEEEVMRELGNPRLIAKTIIETNKTAGIASDGYEEGGTYEQEEGQRQNGAFRTFRFPGWLLGVILIGIVLLIFTVFTTIFFAILPYLFPILLICMIVRALRSR